MIFQYIRLLRPHQYIKNLFICIPPFFAGKMLDVDVLINITLAFFTFSFCASAIYIFNDYNDIDEDKKHPTKKNRPLASGAVSKKEGLILMIFLLTCGTILTATISIRTQNAIFALIAIYLVMNLLYTIILKHIAILDITIISIGFIIRLFVGSYATDTMLSMWIVLVTFLLACFLAVAKRRDDMLLYIQNQKKTRKVIDGYNMDFINVSMGILASITIVSYIMYTISPEVISKVQSDKIYLTVIWVLLGFLRYFQLTFVENNSGTPALILLTDRFTQLVVLAWILNFGVLLYL